MPTSFDIWVSRGLAGYLYRHPFFDLSVQSLIAHNVFGGLWFAMALFIFWARGKNVQTQGYVQRKVWVTILGSMSAVVLAYLASLVIHCLPPSENPLLADLYPDYLDTNPNVNSFPSQSTAVYTAVAAGIFSLSRKTGAALGVAAAFLVALPRMYVGGHYLSDVLAGLILGLAAYAGARRLFEPHILPWLEQVSQRYRSVALVSSVIAFLWISEVAVEFRDLVWAKRVIRILWYH